MSTNDDDFIRGFSTFDFDIQIKAITTVNLISLPFGLIAVRFVFRFDVVGRITEFVVGSQVSFTDRGCEVNDVFLKCLLGRERFFAIVSGWGCGNSGS